MNKVFKFKHTSKVSPSQTAGQIHALLVRLGAKNIATSIEDGEISSMAFIYDHDGTEIAYRLPIRWKPIWQSMKDEVENKPRRRTMGEKEMQRLVEKTKEQAKRTAWRIALEWLRIQVAFVETGARDILEVFMADIIAPGTDLTLGEVVKERGIAALMLPEPVMDGD